MGIVFRQSVKTSIIIFTGAVLGALLMLLSTHMVPDKQLLGFTRTITNQAVVFSQLLLFGLQGTLAVFIHRYDDEERKRHLLITISLLLPLVFIALAAVLYILFNSQALQLLFQPADILFMKRYYLWLPVFVAFFAYQILIEQYLASQMKLAIATFMREVLLRLLNIGLVCLFYFNYIGVDGLVAGSVLIYAGPVAILLYLSFRTRNFGFSFKWNTFTKAEYKEIAHFAWYHTLVSVSTTFMGFIDQLMLASKDKSGLSSVAVYSVAVFIMAMLYIPYKAMVPASFPNLAKAFKDNDMERARDVFRRSTINILIASVVIVALICCNLSNIISVFPAGYEAISPLVMIMLAGRIVDIATGMNDQIVTVSKYYKFNFYMSVVLVALMFAFNTVLIPRYGYYGAAGATTLALILYNAGKYIFVYYKLDIQPFTRQTGVVLLAGVATCVVGYALPYMVNFFVDIAIRSTVIVVVYTALLLWLRPSKDLDEYITSIMKNKRLF